MCGNKVVYLLLSWWTHLIDHTRAHFLLVEVPATPDPVHVDEVHHLESVLVGAGAAHHRRHLEPRGCGFKTSFLTTYFWLINWKETFLSIIFLIFWFTWKNRWLFIEYVLCLVDIHQTKIRLVSVLLAWGIGRRLVNCLTLSRSHTRRGWEKISARLWTWL